MTAIGRRPYGHTEPALLKRAAELDAWMREHRTHTRWWLWSANQCEAYTKKQKEAEALALQIKRSEAEQLTLDRIAAMRRCGLSWSVVARRLNEAKSRTRGGKEWTRVSVAEVFNRAMKRAPSLKRRSADSRNNKPSARCGEDTGQKERRHDKIYY